MHSTLSKPFVDICDVTFLYMQHVIIAPRGVVKKIDRSLFFKLFLIVSNLIARVVCKMAKLDNFVQYNLFCHETKVKSVQVHIRPKLKEKGKNCKPEIVCKFLNSKPDSVSKFLKVEPVGIINTTSVRTVGTQHKSANGFHDVAIQVEYLSPDCCF